MFDEGGGGLALVYGVPFWSAHGLSVSHLQFAEDTLLLGEKSWANVHALRAVLVLKG